MLRTYRACIAQSQGQGLSFGTASISLCHLLTIEMLWRKRLLFNLPDAELIIMVYIYIYIYVCVCVCVYSETHMLARIHINIVLKVYSRGEI